MSEKGIGDKMKQEIPHRMLCLNAKKSRKRFDKPTMQTPAINIVFSTLSP